MFFLENRRKYSIVLLDVHHRGFMKEKENDRMYMR